MVKKIIYLLSGSIFLILCVFFPAIVSANTALPGDFNGDGVVNIYDYNAFIGYFTNANTVTSNITSDKLIHRADGVKGLWMNQGNQWVSVTGERTDVKEFGASGSNVGSNQDCKGKMDANSNILTLTNCPGNDFKVNQGINIGKATPQGPLTTKVTAVNGTSLTLADPAQISVSDICKSDYSDGSGCVRHDDTDAIQSAIDSLSKGNNYVTGTTGPTGTVYFPHGTYSVRKPLKIGQGMMLMGSGQDATKILNWSYTNDTFQCLPAGDNECRHIVIRDMSILGDQNATAGSGINLGSGTEFLLENLIIIGHFNGIRLKDVLISRISNVRVMRAKNNAFLSEGSMNAVTFQNTYALESGSHGYNLLAPQYTAFVATAADGNGGDGYHLYGDSNQPWAAPSVTFSSAGAEGNAKAQFYIQGGIVTFNSYTALLGGNPESDGVVLEGVTSATLSGCNTGLSGGFGIHLKFWRTNLPDWGTMGNSGVTLIGCRLGGEGSKNIKIDTDPSGKPAGSVNLLSYSDSGGVNNNWTLGEGVKLGIGTANPQYTLDVKGTVAGSGPYVNTSWSGYKENFQKPDMQEVLDKINKLDLKSWQYKPQFNPDDNFRHLSPFSEDFYKSFGLGRDERTITSLDVAGIGLVGLQALSGKITPLIDSSSRGSIVIPKGESSVNVITKWEKMPVSIVATPDYETSVWITDKSRDGFRLHVSSVSSLDQSIDWRALW